MFRAHRRAVLRAAEESLNDDKAKGAQNFATNLRVFSEAFLDAVIILQQISILDPTGKLVGTASVKDTGTGSMRSSAPPPR